MRDERNYQRKLDQAVNQLKLRKAVIVMREGDDAPQLHSVTLSDSDRAMLQAMRISCD
jgi:hypothetical protein